MPQTKSHIIHVTEVTQHYRAVAPLDQLRGDEHAAWAKESLARTAALEVFPKLESGKTYIIRVTKRLCVTKSSDPLEPPYRPWEQEFQIDVDYAEIEVQGGSNGLQ